jgi:hypothetical protein
MFLVEPRGQPHRELWSEDCWAWCEHEVHGEGKVVAVSTPGPSLIGIFVAGASSSDAASPSKGRDKEVYGCGKDGYSVT